MSPQQAAPKEQPHRNHGLFSDYYLDVTLPGRPGWGELLREARPVMEEISGLFATYTPSTNEAQVEKDLIRPILNLLGHTFEVQPALATPDGTKRPDYVLYKSATALNANKNGTLNDELLRGSAVADAKHLGSPARRLAQGARRPVHEQESSGAQRAPVTRNPFSVGEASSLRSR